MVLFMSRNVFIYFSVSFQEHLTFKPRTVFLNIFNFTVNKIWHLNWGLYLLTFSVSWKEHHTFNILDKIKLFCLVLEKKIIQDSMLAKFKCTSNGHLNVTKVWAYFLNDPHINTKQIPEKCSFSMTAHHVTHPNNY